MTTMAASTIERLMLFLRDYPLTRAEKLQIVNLLPKSEVEFYVVSSPLVPCAARRSH